MKKPLPPFGLRLPPDLKQWLVAKALENHRSLNAEIIKRLEDTKKAEEAALTEH